MNWIDKLRYRNTQLAKPVTRVDCTSLTIDRSVTDTCNTTIPTYVKEIVSVKFDSVTGVGKTYFSSIPHFTEEFRGVEDEIISINVYPPIRDNIFDIMIHYISDEMAKRKNPVLFFDNLHEGQVIGCIVTIHKILKILNVNPQTVYFFSSTMNAKALYEEFCESNNISDRLILRVINVWERHVFKRVPEEYLHRENTVSLKPKKFICFNRVARRHRIALMGLMHEMDLVKEGYYSFFPEFYNKSPLSEEIHKLIPHVSSNLYSIISKQINANMHTYPLLLNSEFQENANYVKTTDMEFYINSYFSIVTETFFFDTPREYDLTTTYDEKGVFFSEKIFKPIICKHPFVMLNRPNSLKYLRELGYRTFHPYINEDYDLIENDESRLLAIVNEIKRLCNMNDTEWVQWQKDVASVVEHNFNTIISKEIHDHYYK